MSSLLPGRGKIDFLSSEPPLPIPPESIWEERTHLAVENFSAGPTSLELPLSSIPGCS